MNPRKTTIATLAALSVSLALADDFKTIRGKEYKNATINRVEPDGLVLRTKSGISKVYFTELPQDVQERFHYNAQQAAQFTSQTIEEVRLAQQQKIAADNKRAAEIAKNLELVRQQEEAEIQRQHEAKMQPNEWNLSNTTEFKLIPNPLIPDLRKASQNTRTSLHRTTKSILEV